MALVGAAMGAAVGTHRAEGIRTESTEAME